ncbi:phosphoglycolate phosphatase [Acidianus sulfidivorans JP7]|uniref:Phosphoglycolate phosphatase n=1 Tax=Acidianus sulfidivorans JP7 TaxID=619593 RepID=A0A2U9IM51_9CREN|nr:phosphoglycolate phosphatase [Acidianus sulfidivorans]AWR97106.1 phosphoglycolate phosphatase [Acidianus sulfidivorans JP7]
MIKLILTDLDGTLTLDKGTFKVNLDAIDALRRLEDNGIKIAIVSGNSYPVIRGLTTYFGFSGGFVAENGCVVHYRQKLTVCKKMDKNLVKEFKEKFNVKDSWQNEYRECDFGFSPPNITDEMKKWAEEKGLYINSSGYAVHIALKPAGKSLGVRKLIELHNLNKEEVAAIGDSLTDIDMFNEVGLKVAVSNSDDKLKEKANLILNLKSGEGVKEFATMIMEGKLWN